MEQTILVGNYSNSGINILNFNDKNFEMKCISCIGSLPNNSYICKNKNDLYSVIEIEGDENNNGGYVAHYTMEPISSKPIDIQSSCGKAPCFLVLNKLYNILYVANYASGSLVAFKIEKDGQIGKQLLYKDFENISHIHHIQFSSDYKKIYIIDLGSDKIIKYNIDYKDEKLTLEEPVIYKFPQKTEPRHMVIDKHNNIFVVTEISCKIYKFDSNLILLDQKSILPLSTLQNKNYTGCAIIMDSKEQYIYISVRGHNSISVFDVFNLHLIQNIDCNGITPRDISFDKYQNFLMCANQNSNNISIFSIHSGKLKYQNEYKIEKPSCIIID